MPKPSLDRILRKRDQVEATVTYTELLFDLIYVFAVTQLSHFLLHHLDLVGIIESVILWLGVWLLWQHTIWMTNWFNPEARAIRLFLFGIMVVGLFMTAAIPEAFGARAWLFVASYVTIQIGRTLYILLLLGHGHSLRDNYKRLLIWTCISSLFWVAGAFAGEYARLALWAVAVLSDYTAPMFRFYLPGLGHSSSGRDWTIDGSLLLERCKLFVIIAFGETILMTGASLSEITDWTPDIICAALVSFLGSLAMWWIYFDVSSEAATRKIRQSEDPGSLGLKYNAVHAILVGAIIVCAVGDELVVNEPDGRVNAVSLYVMIYGPIIYILANMAFKWLTCRTVSFSHMAGAGLLVLLIPVSFFISILAVNAAVLGILTFVALLEWIKLKREAAS